MGHSLRPRCLVQSHVSRETCVHLPTGTKARGTARRDLSTGRARPLDCHRATNTGRQWQLGLPPPHPWEPGGGGQAVRGPPLPRAQHRGPRQVLEAGAAGLLGLRTEDERSLREPCSELGLRGEETQTLVATPLKSAEGTSSHGRPAGPSRCPLLPSGPHASVSAAPLPRRPLLFLCTPDVFPSLGQHPPGPRAACCPGAPAAGSWTTREGRGWQEGLGTRSPLLEEARQRPVCSDLQRVLLGPEASLRGLSSEVRSSGSVPHRACLPVLCGSGQVTCSLWAPRS